MPGMANLLETKTGDPARTRRPRPLLLAGLVCCQALALALAGPLWAAPAEPEEGASLILLARSGRHPRL